MYLDLWMLLNFAVDYLLLLGANQLSGFPSDQRRLLFASALGGIYSGGCLVPGFGFLGAFHWRMVSLGLMALLAFGWRRNAWRRMAAFLLLSLALGGMAELAGQGSAGLLLVCAGLLWLGCTLLLRGGLSQRRFVPLDITCGQKTVSLTALRDTGNTLLDPVTGEQVLVIGQNAACTLTGLTPQQLESPIETLEGHPLPGLRLIPYRAVGQPGGLLLGMQIQDVLLGGTRQPSVVAFSPGRIGDGNYQALAGGSL